MRVDFQKVSLQLQGMRITVMDQAKLIGHDRHRVATMRDGHMPRHDVGEKLIALWCEKTGKTRRELPMKQD